MFQRMKRLKKFIKIFFLLFLLTSCNEGGVEKGLVEENISSNQAVEKDYTPHETIQYYFDKEESDQQVLILAEVEKVLSDDRDGSQHQRFILKLDNGQTVLVAHNIDLAPRVSGIEEGDEVEVFGEYEWNNKGGVIHWTHHDPDGDHADGYILHNDKIYQ